MSPLRNAALGLSLLGALGAGGCAKGGDGSGGGTGRTDGGVVGTRDGSTTRDGGRDGSTTATCEDEGHGGSCEAATDLGSLAPGDAVVVDPGVLDTAGAEDWFSVTFPSLGMPGMAGGGTPTVELTTNEGEAFRVEIRSTCAATLGCGDGRGARDLGSWSFTDDRSPAEAEMSGENDFSTRNTPWPGTIYVRVYRAVGPADCKRYQLRVSR